MLDEASNRHPNMKLVRQIGATIPFLDILIGNKNGVLATSVYHKSVAESYLVPFTSDHPRHVFQNIVETALIRALRYSSTWSTFNAERRSIQLTLLYNGSVVSEGMISITHLFVILVISHDILMFGLRTSSPHISIFRRSVLCQRSTMQTNMVRSDQNYSNNRRMLSSKSCT